MSTPDLAAFAERAGSIAEAAGLRQFGYADDTVRDVVNLIVLLQEQAWIEGHGVGMIDAISSFSEKLSSVVMKETK